MPNTDTQIPLPEGWLARKEWFGFRMTLRFRDPTDGTDWVQHVLLYTATGEARMDGPHRVTQDSKVSLVPVPVLYYACGEVQRLIRGLEERGHEVLNPKPAEPAPANVVATEEVEAAPVNAN